MKEDKVFFKNSKGQKLCGLLSMQSKKAPIIVRIHGIMPRTDKSEWGVFDKFQPKIFDAGFSTFRFDLSGHGESDGDHVDVSLENYKDDLKHAIDFAEEQKHTDIGILAHSFGCTTTISLNDKRPKVIVLNSTAILRRSIFNRVYSGANPNWKNEVKEKGYFVYMKKKLKPNREKVGMNLYNLAEKINFIREISKVKQPLLMLSGGKDEYLPPEEIKELFDGANEPKQLIFDKDANHNFENKPNKLSTLAIDWFKRYLK
jgi:uncharacterized protein